MVIFTADVSHFMNHDFYFSFIAFSVLVPTAVQVHADLVSLVKTYIALIINYIGCGYNTMRHTVIYNGLAFISLSMEIIPRPVQQSRGKIWRK